MAFAEMHDTPVRMVAKGVLHGIVPWARARPFLALRLKRRYPPPPSSTDLSKAFSYCLSLFPRHQPLYLSQEGLRLFDIDVILPAKISPGKSMESFLPLLLPVACMFAVGLLGNPSFSHHHHCCPHG